MYVFSVCACGFRVYVSSAMFKSAHVVLSDAVSMAFQLKRTSWVIEIAVPAILDADWAGPSIPCGVKGVLIREISSWKSSPDLCGHVDGLIAAIDPSFVPVRTEPVPPSEWHAAVDSGNAFKLARFLKQFDVSTSGYSGGADLPVVRECTPRGFKRL